MLGTHKASLGVLSGRIKLAELWEMSFWARERGGTGDRRGGETTAAGTELGEKQEKRQKSKPVILQ